MPSEYVKGTNFSEVDDTDEAVVKVGWSDGYVQVASLVRDAGTHEESEVPDGYTAWFVTLDRHGINQLIKKLRVARDRAYGRDE